jgi:hypothetical protein
MARRSLPGPLRAPSFSNLSLFERLQGMMLPDALAVMGSLTGDSRHRL